MSRGRGVGGLGEKGEAIKTQIDGLSAFRLSKVSEEVQSGGYRTATGVWSTARGYSP